MNEATGRARGGIARMEGTTSRERRALAKKAAAARWSSDIKEATHGSEDHPLKIGNIEIPCYVLEDETRVLSQRGTMGGLSLGRGTGAGISGDRLVNFLSGKSLSPYVSSELMEVIKQPIRFRPPNGGVAFGYPATILADICDAVLASRKAGDLHHQQHHIADQCELLVRGFARVGIIALVDEATGYQRDRTKNALARILEAFVAKELQPWVKTFPDEYYAQMFRLRGLEYDAASVKRPQYFGTLTNDIIYKRLAPGVLAELKKVIPKTESGHRKGALSQGLTRNIGYPKLREHLGAAIAFMKISKNYLDFVDMMDQHYPRFGEQYRLPFPYEPDQDDGKGM
jgi:hypothetical protein